MDVVRQVARPPHGGRAVEKQRCKQVPVRPLQHRSQMSRFIEQRGDGGWSAPARAHDVPLDDNGWTITAGSKRDGVKALSNTAKYASNPLPRERPAALRRGLRFEFSGKGRAGGITQGSTGISAGPLNGGQKSFALAAPMLVCTRFSRPAGGVLL